MRTTLTLDAEVAGKLRGEMRRTGKGLKALVNEALKRGLDSKRHHPKAARFRVKPRALHFKPGIDLDRLNQLADELEVEAAAGN